MPQYDVYGLGNALLDIEYEVTPAFLAENNIDKGVMTLVDEARQLELATLLGNESRKKVACGGSAANTMIALEHFGGRGFYTCKIASDQTGDHYYKDMRDCNLDSTFDTQHRQEGNTGTCMVFVTHDADRTMYTHLGISESLSVNELNLEALKNSKYLYIEGYLMTSPTAFEAVQLAKKTAQENGVKVSITLSDPFIVGNFKSQFEQTIGDGVDLVFCNEEEAMMYTGTQTAQEAAEVLKQYSKQFVITLGSKGSLIFDGKEQMQVSAEKVEVIDTLGAGDMYAGTFLAGITQGMTYLDAGIMASRASDKIVTQYGPRLSREEVQAIKNEMMATQ